MPKTRCNRGISSKFLCRKNIQINLHPKSAASDKTINNNDTSSNTTRSTSREEGPRGTSPSDVKRTANANLNNKDFTIHQSKDVRSNGIRRISCSSAGSPAPALTSQNNYLTPISQYISSLSPVSSSSTSSPFRNSPNTPRSSGSSTVRSRLKPEDDTLAQFQDALRNIDAQKRARQIIQTHWKQQMQKGQTLHKDVYKEAAAESETLKKEIVSQLEAVDSLLQETNFNDELRDESFYNEQGCSTECFDADITGDKMIKSKDVKAPEEKIKNSKLVFSSGQIVQDPEALAAAKSKEVKVSSLRKALDNMKNYDEDKIKKIRKRFENEDTSKVKKKKGKAYAY